MGKSSILLLTALPFVMAGCQIGGQAASEVPADAFYASKTTPHADQSPPPSNQAVAANPAPAALPAIVPARLPDPVPQSAPAPAPAVETSAPAVSAATGPATGPSTQGGMLTKYMTAGAVIADVSGTPIYADKVIQALVPELSAQAKERDLASYSELARYEIYKKIIDLRDAELMYAAAVQNLNKDEKDFIERYTMSWRHDLITAAEGSESLARRRAEAEGMSLDEKVKEQYRLNMIRLLFERKIRPQVRVSADEMRAFYDQHVKTMFTETAQAKYRVIRIMASQLSDDPLEGRNRAINAIRDLHDQAVNMTNEEFAKVAGSATNHDKGLRATSGLIGTNDGWVERGVYAVTQVEDEVWKLQPGQVTEPIEVGNSFYIARLEQRKPGRVQPFEDQDVQDKIRAEIEKPLLEQRRQMFLDRLSREAVISPDPWSERDPRKQQQMIEQMVQPVLEMAVQRYPEWAASK